MRPVEYLDPNHTRDKRGGVCNTTYGCGKPVTTFRDDLSRKEFEISGLCQKCQDDVFGE